MRLLCLTIWLLCGFPVFATDTYPIQYIGIEQGLSNNTVVSIYKDRFGFMWFGTHDGLNRYDGYGFQVFRKNLADSNTLLYNEVSAFTEDARGHMWIATRRGVCIYNYNTSSFRTVQYKPYAANTPVKKIEEDTYDLETDPEGNVFIATAGAGVMIQAPGKDIAVQIPLKRGDNVSGWYSVFAIKVVGKRNVWMMVDGYGLCRYDYDKKQIVLVSNSVEDARSIEADANGNLWIGTNRGLYKYDMNGGNMSLVPTPDNLYNNRILSLCIDKTGLLWIGSDGGGIGILNTGTGELTSLRSDNSGKSITSDAISYIYADDENRRWIGTLRGGINIIDKKRNLFTTIAGGLQHHNGLLSDFVFSFCEDKDKDLWIGTDGGGVTFWDRTHNQYKTFRQGNGGLSGNNVSAIVTGENDEIWIGSYNGGIDRYSKHSGQWKHYDCRSGNDRLDNHTWRLLMDSQHQLWAATCVNGFLYKYNKTTDRFEVFDNNIRDILSIAEDKEGNLWVGNYQDLVKVDKQHKAHQRFKIGVNVRDIYADNAGSLWIATHGLGLHQFNIQTQQFTGYTVAEGLCNNVVLAVEEDLSGNLWVSTFSGISRFDKVNRKFESFYYSDGLQSNQFNYNASARLQSGELLFGGIKGFNLFQPDSIRHYSDFPRIALTGIRVLNEPVKTGDAYWADEEDIYNLRNLRLPFNKAVFALGYTALEFSRPDKIKYAYYLEGWDKGWNYVNDLRTANYSRLEDGKYTLHIKSTNAEGVWNTQEKLISVTILPPWWRTWWAYSFYMLVAGGLLYLYNSYKSRQVKLQYELAIARLTADKEKELNEKKISFFTYILHEFRTPLTLIINPLKEFVSADAVNKDPRELNVVYRNAKRLLGLVDQLLLFRKAEAVEQQLRVVQFDLVAIGREVYSCFSQHASFKHIDCRFIANTEPVMIYADKEKIEIILFNLISNAFKFTDNGGIIEVVVEEQERTVSIKVKDSGRGIPAEVGDKLFEYFYQADSKEQGQKGFGIGLSLAKKLTDNHKGKLTYTSEPGKGTTFCVELQKGKDHFPIAYLATEDGMPSTFLDELMEEPEAAEQELNEAEAEQNGGKLHSLTSELPSMLIVDDNADIRNYIRRIFSQTFTIYEAADGLEGYELAVQKAPDIVISDIMMTGITGIELCGRIKENPATAHIPVILLTASASTDVKLKGIEGGAEDYITKPFDKDILIARVQSILKGRNSLQQYFYNAITLKPNFTVAGEHKEFIEKCIVITENHLDDPNFNIKTLAREIRMSHSTLYKRVKAVSGLSINEFIRYLRLRKAAELFINTDHNVTQVAYTVGFNDIKYFREQFHKLFEMNPSEYIKRYRRVLGNKTTFSTN